MAKGIQIASVFTAIGFKVEKKDLDRLQKQLGQLKKDLRNFRSLARINVDVKGRGLQATKRQLMSINSELAKVKSKTISVRVSQTGGGGGGTAAGAARGAAFGGALGGGLGQFAKGAGAAGVSAFAGAGIFQTTAEIDALKSALLAVSGGAKEGAEQFRFLEETSDRLGINFLSSAKAFKGLLAAGVSTGFGIKQSQELFTATASAARVLGLSADDTAGSLRAVQQMLQKGKISSEELRQQLAERLPFAMGAMEKATARLLGKQELARGELDKLLEKGELIAKDVLPLFAEELLKLAKANGGLERAQKGPLAMLARMQNSFVKLQDRIGRSEFVAELSELFQALTRTMDSSIESASTFGRVLAVLVDAFTALLNIVTEIPGWLIAIAVLFLPFTRWLAILSAIVLVIEDIMVGFQGGESFIFNMIEGMELWEKILVAGILPALLLALARMKLMRIAAVKTAAAQANAFLGAGKGGKLGLLGKGGLVGLAAFGGIEIGGVISKLIEGTSVNDAIGEGVARVFALFGSDEAKEAIARTEAFEALSSQPASSKNVEITVKVEADDGLTASQADTEIESN